MGCEMRWFWLTVPCAFLLLAACGDGPVEPRAPLPATYDGEFRMFTVRNDTDWLCVGDASVTVAEDGSGNLEYGAYTGNPELGEVRRICSLWYPGPTSTVRIGGRLIGSWVTSDTLEFHIEESCGDECTRPFHAEESDVWRAFVSTDSMKFSGIESSELYRFTFVGEGR